MKRLLLIVGVGLALLTGCAALPTQGPVLQETRRSRQPGPGGVAIAPDPPPDGATESLIIDGFLHAMATYQPGYPAARLYLTEEAQQAWRPESGVTVYADTTPPRAAAEPVTIIGRVAADGSFTAHDERIRYDFRIERNSAGQLRISNPPEGILISRYLFATAYVRSEVYFLDQTGATLVPDTRYVARGTRDATSLVRMLLNGPSNWLAPAVITAAPHEVGLAGTVTGSGILTIPLRAAPAPAQAAPFAAQLAATLRQIPHLDGFRITVVGRPVVIDGQRSDGSAPLSLADRYDPLQGLSTQLFGIQNDRLVRVSEAPGEAPRAVSGIFGTQNWSASGLAITRDGLEAALVVGPEQARELHRGPVDGGETRKVLAAAQLLRPQYSRAGHLWAMTASGSLSRITGDQIDQVPVRSLDGMVVAFRISPDGQRMAVIVEPENGRNRELQLLRIDAGGVWAAARRIPLVRDSTELTELLDVGWSGPTTLTVLKGGEPRPEVVEVDVDGVTVRDIGRADDWAAVTLTTSPRSSVRKAVADNARLVWLYQGGLRWAPLPLPTDGAAAPTLRLPTYPG